MGSKSPKSSVATVEPITDTFAEFLMSSGTNPLPDSTS